MNLCMIVGPALVLLLAFASPRAAGGAENGAEQKAPITQEQSLAWLRTELAAALEEGKQRKVDLANTEKAAAAPAPAEMPAASKEGGQPGPSDGPAEAEDDQKEPVPATAPAARASADELKTARLRVLEAERRVRALETTIAAVRGAHVQGKDAKEALAALTEWRGAVEREVSIEPKPAKGEKPAPLSDAQVALGHLDKLLGVVERASAAADALVSNAQTKTKRSQLEFERGGRLQYGPTVSLVRFSTSRAADEPGRHRNYEPQLQLVPSEFGFQFVYEPVSRPWRLPRLDGKSFQLISAGGLLQAQIDKDHAERGAIGIAATLSFFDQVLGLGLGVDLYRGIPTLGANGRRGSDTAYTGLLAWSFARDGELTPENVFFVVTLGLEPVISGLTGQVKDP